MKLKAKNWLPLFLKDSGPPECGFFLAILT